MTSCLDWYKFHSGFQDFFFCGLDVFVGKMYNNNGGEVFL